MSARHIINFAGRVGGVVAGPEGAVMGRRMVGSVGRQLGSVQAGFQTGGMWGAFATMRDPVMNNMMKGAMIGVGVNVSRQMMENSSYGAPITVGIGGAAIRGALGGGMIGGAYGMGRHLALGGLPRARAVAAASPAAAAPAARAAAAPMMSRRARMANLNKLNRILTGQNIPRATMREAFASAQAEVAGWSRVQGGSTDLADRFMAGIEQSMGSRRQMAQMRATLSAQGMAHAGPAWPMGGRVANAIPMGPSGNPTMMTGSYAAAMAGKSLLGF